MKKTRIYAFIVLIAAATGVAISAFAMGIDPPMTNVIGSYAAIVAALIAAKLFDVTDGIYYSGLIFILFASPLGSVLDLYRTWGPYDKIVHFFSGVLIAALGAMVMESILHKLGADVNKLFIIIPLFALFFSGAGAGLWEIFEFTADKIAGGTMQRGMVDTVTDMIAGNFGGLAYSFIITFGHYRKGKR